MIFSGFVKVHQAAVIAHAEERGRREILDREAARSHALIEFLCTRVNQLEVERAVLLKAVTKLEFPIPSISAPPASAAIDLTNTVAAGPVSIFEDVGDDEARRQRIGWDRDGSVVYGAVPAKA